MRWDIFAQYLYGDPSFTFLQAAWTTLWISVVAQGLGVILGLFLSLMRISSHPWLSWPARAYIWFFRGSPLLVQVLLLYQGLPKIAIGNSFFLWPAVVCVLVAFSLNEAAYMAEITRAGISSIDTGQMEAAISLGMRYSLAMRRIIVPQALRVIIPPLGNEFNNMLKTTSIASVIGVIELTYVATDRGSITFSTFELLLLSTLYYLLLTTLWGYVQSWIERRLDINQRSEISDSSAKNWFGRMLGFNFGSPHTNR
jgi:polar amino acid transport system permease protein